jgi:hypothetical protein
MPASRSAIQPDAAPTLFKNARAFETWLKKHHANTDGLWLKIAKRGADEPSITYPEAVEIALCWGWIDGQKKGLDDQHFLQRFTPRRRRSIWSKINVDKVAALIAAGRMQAPGFAQIEAAKADGRRPTTARAHPWCPRTCWRRWKPSQRPRPSLRRSTRPIVLPCCGASRRPSSPRRAPGVSHSWWRCWRAARPSTSSSQRRRVDRAFVACASEPRS